LLGLLRGKRLSSFAGGQITYRNWLSKADLMSIRRLAAEQPEAFAFTPDNLKWAKGQLEKYPEGRQTSAVLPLLWRAQEQCGGWLPEPALRRIADMLDMAYIRVYEIATFYTMFNLSPVGRYYVQLCGTTPCWLRGADALKATCRKLIGAPGEVTEDGLFSWTEVECLAACVNAPVAQINKDYYEDLTPERLERILIDLREGRKVKPGPQNRRHSSEPLGGATTLIDPALYRNGETVERAPEALETALVDQEAKRPGAEASWREADVPKAPTGDGSDQRRR
jgi:NADH-quinone oxidoreductase subunit E